MVLVLGEATALNGKAERLKIQCNFEGQLQTFPKEITCMFKVVTLGTS